MIFTFKLSRRLAQAFAVLVASATAHACGGDSPVESLLSAHQPVKSIVVSPDAVTIAAGEHAVLTAVLLDSTGQTLTDRSITWKSDAPLVANVSSSGEVSGFLAGTATITAVSEGKEDDAVVTVAASDGGGTGGGGGGGNTSPLAGYYVAPSGSSGGDGSVDEPWSLASALTGAGGRIESGDTVWLRGGTYRGDFRATLAGAVGRPIVFRQYPGERAIIDGRLRVSGPDVVFWGFEIMNSAPLSNGKLPGLETHGARSKFINLVIHDVAQQGITFWDGAIDAEVYGCIVYNNGTHENLDHGAYVHNPTGTKVLQDNVFFNNLAYGIHVYAGPEDVTQRNVHLIGNVSFNNGTISHNYSAKGNILVGAEVADAGMRVVDNLLYFSGSTGENLRVGYTASNQDIQVTGNTVWGGRAGLVVGNWSSAAIRNNVIAGPDEVVNLMDVSPSGHQWSGNRYYKSPTAASWRFGSSVFSFATWQLKTGLASADLAQSSTPSTPTVVVRPNRYESGRAHVVIFNWGQQGSVSVNLSGVLALGQRYEIRNVQSLFGNPVASGTYGGGDISLSMGGVAPPQRIGRSTPTPPKTGPKFDTFLVVGKP